MTASGRIKTSASGSSGRTIIASRVITPET
jgi:hypothetical protein